jgi:beta-xylosidase
MKIRRLPALLILAAAFFSGGCQNIAPSENAAPTPAPWQPDLGDGNYRNPVIFADYSDPDVVRVGDDFYLTSSSFTCVPGLPILHSKDLVNWTIIGHALPALVPEEHFNAVQSGGGVWAPAIRFHAGKFYIFYPDPDYGIYVVTATDPAGDWSKPVLVMPGRGLIDPCPLWDDDGKVYLVHAWANSRSGRSNLLSLVSLSDDATKTVGDSIDIILGGDFKVTTLEGPKFYKMNGYYWIFAPVGGVTGGTQAVFRAKDIAGPYEYRSVLAKGATTTNGPHQGGLVDTPDGKQWWFIHFQDDKAYGRITHLEPVVWRADGWPVMGNDPNQTGTGEPVLTFQKPDIGKNYPIAAPQTSDEFNSPVLGLQWQWLANPQADWYSLTVNPGSLRLYSQPANASLVQQPNLLLQKIPAPVFTATVKLSFSPAEEGESAGLMVYGNPCAWIGLVRTATGFRVSQTVPRAGRGAPTAESAGADVKSGAIYLSLAMGDGARVQFSYSEDGQNFKPLGAPVTIAAISGSWIGAKFGLFALAPSGSGKAGYADFDWIHMQAPAPVPQPPDAAKP